MTGEAQATDSSTTISHANGAGTRGKCTFCQRYGNVLRCSRCHSTFYCSQSCQKKHWKHGHKKACKAIAAMIELHGMTAGISMEDASDSATKATAALDYWRETSSSPEVLTETRPAPKVVSKPNEGIAGTRQDKSELGDENDRSSTNIQTEGDEPSIEKDIGSCASTKDSQNYVDANVDGFMVEHMSRLSRYHITFKLSKEMPHGSHLHCTLHPDVTSSTLIVHVADERSEPLIRIKLLRHILPGPPFTTTNTTTTNTTTNNVTASHGTISCDGDRNDVYQIHLSYRSPYEENCGELFDDATTYTTTPTSRLTSLHCANCNHPIVPANKIQRILPMPQGHWDEISDYLICYEGQPATEFSKASNEPREGMVLEDATVFCVHANDAKEAVEVTSMPLYGEPPTTTGNGSVTSPNANDGLQHDQSITLRGGTRIWKDAVVANAMAGAFTVSCGACNFNLGTTISSSSSFRLFKHHLAPTTIRITNFLLHEVIRYAESKAIFTWMIQQHDDLQNIMTAFTYQKQCLLLRLVQWDSQIATANSDTFERHAKLVYEESVDRTSLEGGGEGGQWLWGGVDLCCPPPQGFMEDANENENAGDGDDDDNDDDNDDDDDNAVQSPQPSTVRISLSKEEYDEVKRTLAEGGPCLPQSVVDVTLALKMGRSHVTSAMGMAVLKV